MKSPRQSVLNRKLVEKISSSLFLVNWTLPIEQNSRKRLNKQQLFTVGVSAQ